MDGNFKNVWKKAKLKNMILLSIATCFILYLPYIYVLSDSLNILVYTSDIYEAFFQRGPTCVL